MKSKNNYTEYDDKLFYQSVISGLQKVFIPPVSGTSLIPNKNPESSQVTISAPKPVPLVAVADGTIVHFNRIDEKEYSLILKHENGIFSNYLCFLDPKATTVGTTIKQGEELGMTGTNTCFEILVSPKTIFQDN